VVPPVSGDLAGPRYGQYRHAQLQERIGITLQAIPARPLGPDSLVGLLWIGFDGILPPVRQRSAWLANPCSTVVVAALATVLSARQSGAGRRLRKSAPTTHRSGQQGDLAFIHYR
jgi:hypothetical protein